MRGGEFDTFCVSNPHLSPPIPVQGGVGRNIDRCISTWFFFCELLILSCGPLFVADLPVFINFDLAFFFFFYLLYSGGAACPLLILYTGKSSQKSVNDNNCVFVCNLILGRQVILGERAVLP